MVHIGKKGIVQVGGDLSTGQRIVRSRRQIGAHRLGIDRQHRVRGGQLHALPQVVGKIVQNAAHRIGGGYHDNAAVTLVPVGIIETNGLLLLGGQDPRAVQNMVLKLLGGQAHIQAHVLGLGGRWGVSTLAQADEHRRHDHGDGDDPRHRQLFAVRLHSYLL